MKILVVKSQDETYGLVADEMLRLKQDNNRKSYIQTYIHSVFSGDTPTHEFMSLGQPSLSKASVKRMFSKIDKMAKTNRNDSTFFCCCIGQPRYRVVRFGDGTVGIGCQKFAPEAVKILRYWLTRKG